METMQALDFEAPLVELEARIREFESLAAGRGMRLDDEIATLRRKLDEKVQEIYSNLTNWQKVKLARHPQRPVTGDYLGTVFTDLVELHGDKLYRDDSAIVTYFATVGKQRILLVANEKGADTKDRMRCNFGMPHPEGYRKAMQKMRLAEKFGLPIVILINTPGAYPGIGAEERGQAFAIAHNLMDMGRLRTPIITVIISEGFSGGALGIGVGDRNLIMEYAVFSVISPEGCAAILWRDGSKAPQAADVLKLTSDDLMRYGLMDAVVKEPPGGAHRNKPDMAARLKAVLEDELAGLGSRPIQELVEQRYQKYRRMGEFIDNGVLNTGTRRGD